MLRHRPAAALAAAVIALAAAPSPVMAADTVPVGVTLHNDTLQRIGESGDNWCLTWAADDSQITAMDDGDWLGTGTAYHNRLFRLTGGPDDFAREDLPGYPDFTAGKGSWFGYGIVALGEDIYATTSKTPGPRWSGPFRGFKLLKSSDNGASWARVGQDGSLRPLAPGDPARYEVWDSEMFFLEESGYPHQEEIAYPFSFAAFVQNGRAGAAAPDGHVYIYAPEGAAAHELLLARAPTDRLGERAAWEYFNGYGEDGAPDWSPDLADRKPVHLFPEKSADGHYFGWYSWLPSVVWNEPLGLYIMVNGGTYGGPGMTDSDKDYYHPWMHEETGSLGFWYAENPWGPWTEFFYTDYWTVDDPENRTYQPKLSPKWISPDGRDMVLIFSDAMKNAEGKSHRINYMWNQISITIETAEP